MATLAAGALGNVIANAIAGYTGFKVADKMVKNRRKSVKKPTYSKKRKYMPKKMQYKKRKFGRSRYGKSLKKEVYQLKKLANAGLGTYIYRQRQPGRLIATANIRGVTSISGMTKSFIEVMIDNLPTFNPAVPGTYTFVDFTSGTQSKKLDFVKYNSMMVVTNNYNVPVKVKLWCCVCNTDTSITAANAWNNGLADVGSGLTTATPMLGPHDSPHFKGLYTIVKKVTRVLKAGEVLTLKHSAKPFTYDPSYTDSETDSHLVNYGCFDWMMAVEGVLGHDTTLDEQGTLGAGVDYNRYTTAVIKYQAGADIQYIEVDDNNDSFTNAGVVSSLTDVVKEQYSIN